MELQGYYPNESVGIAVIVQFENYAWWENVMIYYKDVHYTCIYLAQVKNKEKGREIQGNFLINATSGIDFNN